MKTSNVLRFRELRKKIVKRFSHENYHPREVFPRNTNISELQDLFPRRVFPSKDFPKKIHFIDVCLKFLKF